MFVPEPGPVGAIVEPLEEVFGLSVFPDGFRVLAPAVPLALVPAAPPVPIAPGVEALDAPAAEFPDALPPAAPPPACASAKVLESAKAVANAIVLSLMVVSFGL